MSKQYRSKSDIAYEKEVDDRAHQIIDSEPSFQHLVTLLIDKLHSNPSIALEARDYTKTEQFLINVARVIAAGMDHLPIPKPQQRVRIAASPAKSPKKSLAASGAVQRKSKKKPEPEPEPEPEYEEEEEFEDDDIEEEEQYEEEDEEDLESDEY